jgi:hypothetical protein
MPPPPPADSGRWDRAGGTWRCDSRKYEFIACLAYMKGRCEKDQLVVGKLKDE